MCPNTVPEPGATASGVTGTLYMQFWPQAPHVQLSDVGGMVGAAYSVVIGMGEAVMEMVPLRLGDLDAVAPGLPLIVREDDGDTDLDAVGVYTGDGDGSGNAPL